jgi:hypothetical protein
MGKSCDLYVRLLEETNRHNERERGRLTVTDLNK